MSRIRRRTALALGAALWLLSVPAACLFGPFDIGPAEVMRLLGAAAGVPVSGHVDPTRLLVVGDIRLARVCLSLLVGGGLAMAGVVFQGVLRNPLADPFTLGVSSGAALGASVAISFGVTLPAAVAPALVAGLGVVTPAALFGAFAALSLVLLLGTAAGSFRRETVVLAGVVVSTFLAALVSLVKALDEESVSSIVFWIMGSLQGRGWAHTAVLLPPLVLGLAAVVRHARDLDVLALGDTQASQLGMRTGYVRCVLLCGASCITAGCVAVSGVIGFVGLVVPHLLRLVLGAAHGPLLIGAWFGGGILLLWSDVVARTLLSGGAELPVGVVTALVGGPFFCLLLQREQRRERP